jgi:HSP20 family protein
MLTLWTELNPLARFASRRSDGSRNDFDDLRREMNRLFFDFEREFPGRAWSGESPEVTLEDTGEALVLRAEVPGVTEDNLELQVEEGNVTLRGERKEQRNDGHSVHRKERADFRFARSFSLPVKVDSEKTQAVLQHGILTVTLPKAETAKPRKIAVRSS